MPGMGHKMPKDKMYQDGQEKITKTMAQGRSGLYQDRDENGKLPLDRVRLHYDRMDQRREAKMEQLGTLGNAIDQVKAGFKYGGNQFAKEAGEIYDKAKEGISKGYDAFKEGVNTIVEKKNQTFGENFIKDNIIDPSKKEIKTIGKMIMGDDKEKQK